MAALARWIEGAAVLTMPAQGKKRQKNIPRIIPDMGNFLLLHPALSFGDEHCIRLKAQYALPERRHGVAMKIDVRFRWKRGDGEFGEISGPLGWIDFRKRTISLSLAADTAGSICAALSAGKIKALDLDVRPHDGCDTIPWARLCTRTRDGLEL